MYGTITTVARSFFYATWFLDHPSPCPLRKSVQAIYRRSCHHASLRHAVSLTFAKSSTEIQNSFSVALQRTRHYWPDDERQDTRNNLMVAGVGMVEVRSNPHSQGGPRCLGSLGTVCKLANLACGWTSGTTAERHGANPVFRVSFGKRVRLLRTNHAQVYERKGTETWYKVPWLHAPSRAYAHMSCT